MANTSIYRTMGTATNRNIFTLSMWVKMSKTGSDLSAYQFCDFYVSADIRISIYHDPTDNLNCYMKGGGYEGNIFVTNAKYRDTSAWYHFVWRFDTTQATASDRVRLYVNGELATFASTNYPSQNFNLQQGTSSYTQYYGRYGGNTDNGFDGVMSHIHFCDGYSYSADSFGEEDSSTGEWKIKTDPNVQYGNNGHWILKDGNSVTDHSGNSLSFSTAGTLTKTEDNPSNVFATWNPLVASYSAITYSNGNLKATYPGTWTGTNATLGALSGKYYWEIKMNTTGVNNWMGVVSENVNMSSSTLYAATNGQAMMKSSGDLRINNSETSTYGSAYSNGDIMGIAIDLDSATKTIQFYKNGTTNGSLVNLPTNMQDTFIIPFAMGNSSSNAINHEANFGNGYFGTTAVSSAGTNASGNGIFEYDVPANYTALSTKGLNL